MKTRDYLSLVMAVILAVVFGGCEEAGSSVGIPSRIDLGPVGGASSGGDYINPSVILVDSSGFTVEDGGLILEGGEYLHGVFKVAYSGNETLWKVKGILTFKDNGGGELFTRAVYIDTPGSLKSSLKINHSFVSPAHRKSWLVFEKKLEDDSFTFTDIASVEMELSGQIPAETDFPAAPVSQGGVMLIQHSPPIFEGYIPVANSSGAIITRENFFMTFKDQLGRLGYWREMSLYGEPDPGSNYGESLESLGAGESGRIRFIYTPPPSLAAELEVDQEFLRFTIPQ